MASQARPGSALAGVVIPVRSFVLGKVRLADVLDEAARAELAATMADRVVDATGDRPCTIVSSAREVRAWAAGRKLHVLDDPGSLDRAAAAGRDWALAQGLDRYAVVHADLPRITTLDDVLRDGAEPIAVVVADHRGDGTPVLTLPAATPFTFAYGPGSAARHVAEAERRGLAVRHVEDPDLAFDVDLPTDLEMLHDRSR
jgi:2-phospho-L-lactate guanylyltransferase